MKTFLLSIGTRGDIEPFIVLGKFLEKQGEEVVYAFPRQFVSLCPADATVYPLTKRFIELIESRQGQLVMGKASWWAKLKALIFLYRRGREVNQVLVREQEDAINREKPDRLIYHPKCSYPVLWSLSTGKPAIILSAVPYILHHVKGHAHLGFPRNLGEPLNKLTYFIANYGFTKTVYDGQKHLTGRFAYSLAEIKRKILSSKIMYAVSPTLIPEPEYRPKQARVVGYLGDTNANQTTVDPSLLEFLKKHPKTVLLTFGSMVNSEPDRISAFIYKIMSDLQIPTLVNTAAGGLVKILEYAEREDFFFAESLPYETIFDKVHAVIHHGGSGTTHMGLKHGCPTLIIPHIVDQYIWNKRIYDLGLGPKGISINKLPSEKLKELIRDLYSNPSYAARARECSRSMKEEHMENELYEFIINDDFDYLN